MNAWDDMIAWTKFEIQQLDRVAALGLDEDREWEVSRVIADQIIYAKWRLITQEQARSKIQNIFESERSSTTLLLENSDMVAIVQLLKAAKL